MIIDEKAILSTVLFKKLKIKQEMKAIAEKITIITEYRESSTEKSAKPQRKIQSINPSGLLANIFTDLLTPMLRNI